MMKLPLRFLLGCLLSTALPLTAVPAKAAGAESDFRIASIRQMSSADLILVGKEWRKDIPSRLLVSLRTNATMPSSGVAIKAYLYDKDNKLVYTANKPSTIWTRTRTGGIGEVSVPAELKKGAPIDVYFALPEAATKGKWKSAVIVFGKGNDWVAASSPGKIVKEVDFPEKAKIAFDKEFSVFND